MAFFFYPPFLRDLISLQMTDKNSSLPPMQETLPGISDETKEVLEEIANPLADVIPIGSGRDSNKKYCVVVCLDTALAETKWRQSLVFGTGPADWPTYYDAAIYDPINASLAATLDQIHSFNDKDNSISIFIFADRPVSECASDTKDWLTRHMVKYDEIFYRLPNDVRPTHDWLPWQVKHHLADYEIVGIFDEDPTMYEIWRLQDFTVFDPGRKNSGVVPTGTPYSISNKLYDAEEDYWMAYQGVGHFHY